MIVVVFVHVYVKNAEMEANVAEVLTPFYFKKNLAFVTALSDILGVSHLVALSCDLWPLWSDSQSTMGQNRKKTELIAI